MMAIGYGVQSDESVNTQQQYLVRIRDNYTVVKPFDPTNADRILLPYREAEYKVVMQPTIYKYKEIYELAPIY